MMTAARGAEGDMGGAITILGTGLEPVHDEALAVRAWAGEEGAAALVVVEAGGGWTARVYARSEGVGGQRLALMCSGEGRSLDEATAELRMALERALRRAA